MNSFWFIIKQQWTIGEMSIFSNSSHFEWRADLSDTILKGTRPRTIPARFGLIWFRGFRGEDLNVKVYDVRRTDERRTPSDGKSSTKRQTRYFHRLGYWGFIIRLILLRFSFAFFINLHFRKSYRMVLSFRFWALFDYWIFPTCHIQSPHLLSQFVNMTELLTTVVQVGHLTRRKTRFNPPFSWAMPVPIREYDSCFLALHLIMS